jgi:hypothetical protein
MPIIHCLAYLLSFKSFRTLDRHDPKLDLINIKSQQRNHSLTVGKHMRGHFLVSIGILLLMISCKQAETKKTQIIEQKPPSELKPETILKVEEDIAEKLFVENDSLAFAFESELESYAFDSPIFKIELKPYQNHHDKNVIDTIKTMTFKNTELVFYKAKNWEFIIGALIKNTEIELSDSLKIGIKKKTLENKLKTKIESDIVTLGNLEKTSLFTFHFENGILESIKFEGYFD